MAQRTTSIASPLENQPDLSTDQAAAVLHLQPQTLRKAFSQQGAYFGVRPSKAANGRLFWDAAAIRSLKGEVHHGR